MKHCTVLLIKDQRLFMWCLWFLHCIQSNVTHLTHVRGVECVLCIQWPLAPARRKAI